MKLLIRTLPPCSSRYEDIPNLGVRSSRLPLAIKRQSNGSRSSAAWWSRRTRTPDPLIAKQVLSQLSYYRTMDSDLPQNAVGAPLAYLATQALARLAVRSLVSLEESEQLAGDGPGLFGQHRVAGVRQIDDFDPVRSELLMQHVAVLGSGHRVIEPLDDEHRR